MRFLNTDDFLNFNMLAVAANVADMLAAARTPCHPGNRHKVAAEAGIRVVAVGSRTVAAGGMHHKVAIDTDHRASAVALHHNGHQCTQCVPPRRPRLSANTYRCQIPLVKRRRRI